MSEWSIIVTTSQREKRLATALREAGFEVFLPLRRTWRGRYARHAEIWRPVIPGYVFAVMAPHEVHGFHDEGAARLIQVGRRDQLRLIQSITEWEELVASGVLDDPAPQAPKEEKKALPPKTPRNRNRGRKARKAKATFKTFQAGLQAWVERVGGEVEHLEAA